MDVRKGFVDLVGNTPLLRLNRVSDATGCEILGIDGDYVQSGQLVIPGDRFVRRDLGELLAPLKAGGCVIDVKSVLDPARVGSLGFRLWRL